MATLRLKFKPSEWSEEASLRRCWGPTHTWQKSLPGRRKGTDQYPGGTAWGREAGKAELVTEELADSRRTPTFTERGGKPLEGFRV